MNVIEDYLLLSTSVNQIRLRKNTQRPLSFEVSVFRQLNDLLGRYILNNVIASRIHLPLKYKSLDLTARSGM